MIKVSVQIVDSLSGLSQYVTIEEMVKEGFEIENALRHLGIKYNEVTFYYDFTNPFILNRPRVLSGFLENKIVNIIVLKEVVSDQPSRPGENRSVIGASS